MRNINIFLLVVSLLFGQVGFGYNFGSSPQFQRPSLSNGNLPNNPGTLTTTQIQQDVIIPGSANSPPLTVNPGPLQFIGYTPESLRTAAPITIECLREESVASKVCPSSGSPYLQGSVVLINALLVGAKSMGGVNAACSKYKEALDIASGAMSAYNLGCGYAQMACESSCIRALEALNAEQTVAQAEAAAVGYTTPAGLLAKKRLAEVGNAIKAVTAEKQSCDSYKMQLAVGAAGLVSMVVQAKTAAKCDDGTKTQEQICKENPALPECQVNCALEKYATNTKCICEKNPYTPGCTQNTNTTTGTTTRTNSTSRSASETAVPVPGDPNISFGGMPDSSSATGGAGGSPSLMGAGGSGSGSGRGADGADPKSKRTGFNPNILSGEGGGGGGGRFGSGSGSSGDSDGGRYQAYMPGGANDPNRNVAGQAGTAPADITGGGGKSNWEKIRERYVDNKPKLLGIGE